MASFFFLIKRGLFSIQSKALIVLGKLSLKAAYWMRVVQILNVIYKHRKQNAYLETVQQVIGNTMHYLQK